MLRIDWSFGIIDRDGGAKPVICLVTLDVARVLEAH